MKSVSDLIFWFQRKKYAQGRYFICLEPDPLHSTAIYEIIRGPYKGVRFCYTKVNITESGVNFDFHIVKWSESGLSNYRLVLKQSLLAKTIRKILLVILWKLYNENDGLQFGLKPGEEYEDRTSYIEEPIAQRAIRKKSATIPEE